MGDDSFLIYTTCPDEDTGKKLARLLVESRLAACVNITPHLASVYFWEGRVEEAFEVGLAIKTRQLLKDKVWAFISVHHPYKTPALWGMPIEVGSQGTLEWLRSATLCHENEKPILEKGPADKL